MVSRHPLTSPITSVLTTQSLVGYYEVAMVMGSVSVTDCLLYSSPTWGQVGGEGVGVGYVNVVLSLVSVDVPVA